MPERLMTNCRDAQWGKMMEFLSYRLSIGWVGKLARNVGPRTVLVHRHPRGTLWIPPQTKQKATNHHVGGEAKLRYIEESQILVWPELTMQVVR